MTKEIACFFKINKADNVATATDDIALGITPFFGCQKGEIEVLEPIARGFKIALCDIPEGELIIKYGVSIGKAEQDIPQGYCVHIHNMKSLMDVRSSHFSAVDATPQDMYYRLDD